MKGKASGAFRDIAIAAAAGLAASAAIGVVAALIGIFAGMKGSFEIARSILFVLGALGMFILAGAILARGKKPKFGDVKDEKKWREKFRVLRLPEVVGIVGVFMIAGGCIVDVISRAIPA